MWCPHISMDSHRAQYPGRSVRFSSILQLMRLSLYYSAITSQLQNGRVVEAVPINDIPTNQKPHIIVILADDLGFDDVSFRGSDQIQTPNIDALGYQGQILNRHYVAPMCTPSRSVLMTGKYMIRTGMQHYVIVQNEPWGLPISERTLPEYLKEQGYRTNLVGKWHLGFARENMMPTQRGFDQHRGYLGGYVDYYTHYCNTSGMYGYDMRNNMDVDPENRGKYATDMLTDYAIDVIDQNDPDTPLFLLVSHLAPHSGNRNDPMQAPEEYVKRFDYIRDPIRRTYAAMVSKLDESVGRIVEKLKERDMLKNSLILFTSDNGAPTLGETTNRGSNYPLRGQKDSPWEGAIRSAAVIWAANLQGRHSSNNNLIYLGDWLPTFLGRAMAQQLPQDIDGVDQWDVLNRPEDVSQSPRKEILHNIDPVDGYVSYLRADGFKYVNGTTWKNEYGGWYGGEQRDVPISPGEYVRKVKASKTWQALEGFALRNLTDKEIMDLRTVVNCKQQPRRACNPLEAPCLFNVFADECEMNNLAEEKKDTLRELQEAVDQWKLKAVPINNTPGDPMADPRLHNGNWSPWSDDVRLMDSQRYNVSPLSSLGRSLL